MQNGTGEIFILYEMIIRERCCGPHNFIYVAIKQAKNSLDLNAYTNTKKNNILVIFYIYYKYIRKKLQN